MSNLPQDATSCHQCKTRRVRRNLSFCTSPMGANGRPCRKKYCRHCLSKFYNDAAAPAPGKKASWRCPSCNNACNCAACIGRKVEHDSNLRGREESEQSHHIEPESKRHKFANAGPGMVPALNIPGGVLNQDGKPDPICEQARILLWAVSNEASIREQMIHYASRRNLTEHQKVAALTALLSQAAFPPGSFPVRGMNSSASSAESVASDKPRSMQ